MGQNGQKYLQVVKYLFDEMIIRDLFLKVISII